MLLRVGGGHVWIASGICQRREALGRDGDIVLTGGRGSVSVGCGGDEGGVVVSGHDCG